jgi:hypothetical protein
VRNIDVRGAAVRGLKELNQDRGIIHRVAHDRTSMTIKRVQRSSR